MHIFSQKLSALHTKYHQSCNTHATILIALQIRLVMKHPKRTHKTIAKITINKWLNIYGSGISVALKAVSKCYKWYFTCSYLNVLLWHVIVAIYKSTPPLQSYKKCSNYNITGIGGIEFCACSELFSGSADCKRYNYIVSRKRMTQLISRRTKGIQKAPSACSSALLRRA